MRIQRTYRVVLTVQHNDGTVSRTKAVPVRASSEDRAVSALVGAIEKETRKHVKEIVFRKVSI